MSQDTGKCRRCVRRSLRARLHKATCGSSGAPHRNFRMSQDTSTDMCRRSRVRARARDLRGRILAWIRNTHTRVRTQARARAHTHTHTYAPTPHMRHTRPPKAHPPPPAPPPTLSNSSKSRIICASTSSCCRPPPAPRRHVEPRRRPPRQKETRARGAAGKSLSRERESRHLPPPHEEQLAAEDVEVGPGPGLERRPEVLRGGSQCTGYRWLIVNMYMWLVRTVLSGQYINLRWPQTPQAPTRMCGPAGARRGPAPALGEIRERGEAKGAARQLVPAASRAPGRPSTALACGRAFDHPTLPPTHP